MGVSAVNVTRPGAQLQTGGSWTLVPGSAGVSSGALRRAHYGWL